MLLCVAKQHCLVKAAEMAPSPQATRPVGCAGCQAARTLDQSRSPATGGRAQEAVGNGEGELRGESKEQSCSGK